MIGSGLPAFFGTKTLVLSFTPSRIGIIALVISKPDSASWRASDCSAIAKMNVAMNIPQSVMRFIDPPNNPGYASLPARSSGRQIHWSPASRFGPDAHDYKRQSLNASEVRSEVSASDQYVFCRDFALEARVLRAIFI